MVDCSPSKVLNITLGDATDMEANADVSGIGVVIGFVVTAWISAFLLIIKCLFAHDPRVDPFNSGSKSCDSLTRNKGKQDSMLFRPNPIDVWFLSSFRKIFRVKTSKWIWTAEVLDECVLSMCDIQLMMGFGILISGFAVLSPSPENPSPEAKVTPLSSFHWLVVASNAWFSCVTHLSGMIVLRHSLSRYRWMKLSRALMMFLLLIMVTVAFIPTGYFGWDSWNPTAAIPSTPAVCFFNAQKAKDLWESQCMMPYFRYPLLPEEGSQPTCDSDLQYGYSNRRLNPIDTTAMQSMIFTILLLWWGFATRCFKLFSPLSRGVKRRIRSPVSAKLRGLIRLITPSLRPIPFWGQIWTDAVVTPLFGVFLFLRIHADMFSSMLLEMLWILFTLIWGTLKLAGILFSQVVPPGVFESERIWAFGQVLVVVLASSPLFTMVWKFTVGRIESRRMHQSCIHSYHDSSNTSAEETLAPFNGIRSRVYSTVDPGSVSNYMDKDCYTTASWCSPLIVSCHAGLFGVVLTMFTSGLFQGGPEYTMIQFWITGNGYMPGVGIYLLVGYPAASIAVVVLGLKADDWLKCHSRRWKWCLLFLGGLGFHVVEMVAFLVMDFLGAMMNSRNMMTSLAVNGLFITASGYVLYVLYCLGRSFWKIHYRSSGRS